MLSNSLIKSTTNYNHAKKACLTGCYFFTPKQQFVTMLRTQETWYFLNITLHELLSSRCYDNFSIFLRRSIWHGEVKMATTTMVVSPLATQSSPKNKRRLFAEARQNSLQKLSIIFDHGLKNSKYIIILEPV